MREELSKKVDSVIETIDEHGKPYKFKLVDIVELNEKEYGLFEYLAEKDSKEASEEDEVIVMRILEQDKEFYFEVIDDDAEFNQVLDFLEFTEDEEDDDQEVDED